MMTNLEKYIENGRSNIGGYVWQSFGLDTSFVVADFIDYINYEYENHNAFNIDEKVNWYAEAMTGIYNADLMKWLASDTLCSEYVDNYLNEYVAQSGSTDWNIMNIIRIAQNTEILEAMCSCLGDFTYVLVAKYLKYIGYVDVQEDVIDEMSMKIETYDDVDFDELFEKVLEALGYNKENCGLKQAA